MKSAASYGWKVAGLNPALAPPQKGESIMQHTSSMNPVSKTPKTPYQIARDNLIPEAELHADSVFNRKREGDEWTRAFLDAMNHMAIERGVVKHRDESYRLEAEKRYPKPD